jgi:glycosyltransferase involved in cell wall biosynthesis
VKHRVRVSIITPFLNAERFLAESIESVLAQTREDWELLLVDDGSSDRSRAIAIGYATRYPDRIRVLSHPGDGHRGASATRNLGAAHAQGEYLAYLDADDVYLPDKLARQVPLLDSHPDVGIVYAATEYWYGWTGRSEDLRRDWVWRGYGVAPDVIVPPPRMLTTFLNDGGTVPCMGSVLVRRALVEQVGGWEESFRAVYTDQVFHAKIALNAAALIVDVCLDRYRQHEESSCRTAARSGELQVVRRRYLQWLTDYMRQVSAADPELWRAVRRAQRSMRYPRLRAIAGRLGRWRGRVRRALGVAVPGHSEPTGT